MTRKKTKYLLKDECGILYERLATKKHALHKLIDDNARQCFVISTLKELNVPTLREICHNENLPLKKSIKKNELLTLMWNNIYSKRKGKIKLSAELSENEKIKTQHVGKHMSSLVRCQIWAQLKDRSVYDLKLLLKNHGYLDYQKLTKRNLEIVAFNEIFLPLINKNLRNVKHIYKNHHDKFCKALKKDRIPEKTEKIEISDIYSDLIPKRLRKKKRRRTKPKPRVRKMKPKPKPKPKKSEKKPKKSKKKPKKSKKKPKKSNKAKKNDELNYHPKRCEVKELGNNKIEITPYRGVFIDKKWMNKIVKGEKTWELRRTNCNIREPVYLIHNKKIYGIIQITDSIKTTTDHLIQHKKKHQVSKTEMVKYFKDAKKKYYWKINLLKVISPTPILGTGQTWWTIETQSRISCKIKASKLNKWKKKKKK